MTQAKVTDEMLMAFVDGELDAAEAERIGALIAADAGLAGRAEKFRQSRLAVQRALSAGRDEPPPAHLVAGILGTGQDLAPRRGLGGRGWAVAASVAVLAAALGFGASRYLDGPVGEASLMATATSGSLLARLAETPAGGSVAVGPATAMVTGSYPVEGGYCRLYAVSAETEQVRALACGGDGAWTVPVAVLEGGGGFQPASAAEAIDIYLDTAGAGAALDAAGEQAAIAAGWAAR